MKTLDTILQRWRIRKALPFINGKTRVLDIGTHDGALFHFVDCNQGVGIDPGLVCAETSGPIKLVKGLFPDAIADEQPFDAIAILAVFEHLDASEQKHMVSSCFDYLVDGGVVALTVPSPQVDRILDLLFFLKLSDAMGEIHDDHYGFSPDDVVPRFEEGGFRLVKRTTFQLGLNNLFVFEKPKRVVISTEGA